MDAINRIRKGLTGIDYATKGELVEASKAVHDRLKDDFTASMKSLHDAAVLETRSLYEDFRKSVFGQINALVESSVSDTVGRHMKDLDTTFVIRMAKALDKNFDRLVGDGLEARFKTVSDQYKAEITALRKAFDAREEKLLDTHVKQLEAVRKSYEEGLARIHEVLKALTIPAPAVTVQVPEARVEVTVPPAQVCVTVPEQAAPVVNVAPPEVNVDVPPPRLVKKTFTYDVMGRPETVVEEEIKE